MEKNKEEILNEEVDNNYDQNQDNVIDKDEYIAKLNSDLNEQKKKGVAVIFVGEDLDVLLKLSDRIMVIGSGIITGIVDGRSATKEQLGYLMTANTSENVQEGSIEQ